MAEAATSTNDPARAFYETIESAWCATEGHDWQIVVPMDDGSRLCGICARCGVSQATGPVTDG
jgi:hypothetical protein